MTRYASPSSSVAIERTRENLPGRLDVPVLYATCKAGDHVVGPITGHGPRSVAAACAILSKDCPCGRKWHDAGAEEDR